MAKEIELKFLVDSFDPIRKKLKKLGAKLEWRGKEKNWYFDTPTRTLGKRDTALRIKKMGDLKLTLKDGKYVKRGVKVAEEYQISIDNLRVAKIILEKLGFSEILYYTKTREHWRLPRAWVELDNLGGKKFVEIEASHAKLKSLAQKLNLDFKNSSTKSYTQILKEK